MTSLGKRVEQTRKEFLDKLSSHAEVLWRLAGIEGRNILSRKRAYGSSMEIHRCVPANSHSGPLCKQFNLLNEFSC